MFVFTCPHCEEDNIILFGEEIGNLLKHGISDFRCHYCKETFEIYSGKDKYEVRIKIR